MLAHGSRVQSFMMGNSNSWNLKQLVRTHPHAAAQFFFLFKNSGPIKGIVPPTMGRSSHLNTVKIILQACSEGNLSQIIPHRQARGLVSQVSLGPVKLSMNTNHQRNANETVHILHLWTNQNHRLTVYLTIKNCI